MNQFLQKTFMKKVHEKLWAQMGLQKILPGLVISILCELCQGWSRRNAS
jgi:hypothetical protein